MLLRSLVLLIVIILLSSVSIIGQALSPVLAQSAIPIECGSVREGQFTRDRERIEYQLPLSANERIFADAEVLQGNLGIVVAIYRPDDTLIDGEDNPYFGKLVFQAQTDFLFAPGIYTIVVQAKTSTGGAFQIFFGCVRADKTVASAASNRFIKGVGCPDNIQSSIAMPGNGAEVHRYYILLPANVSLSITAEVAQESSDNLKVVILIASPKGETIAGEDNPYFGKAVFSVQTEALREEGIYRIVVSSGVKNSPIGGNYTIYFNCTLSGKAFQVPTIQTTDTTSSSDSQSTGEQDTNSTIADIAPPTIGFPGLAPVNFAEVNLSDLDLGDSEGGTIRAGNNNIQAYTFSGTAGQTATLTFNRASGENKLNLGVVVLVGGNKVVFQSSLVTSTSLTTTFTLPETGEYTIGVFKIDLYPVAQPEDTKFELMVTLQ